jgi:putative ABC transport system permease protein
LGLSSGSVLTVAGHRRTVTGEAQDPADLRGLQVYAPPGEIPAEQGLALADTHRTAVTWPMVERLNRAGALVTSRAAVLSPPARGPEPTPADPRTRAEEIGIAIIAIGLAVLEAVLLAGAAFAVGARRQARDLALLAATGADAGQVRDVVLGSGVVLGVAGSVLGIGLGIAASAAALPGVQHLADADSGAFDLRPVELAVVGVVGLLTGIVAAVLPARAAARMDVVAALTGRRGTVSASRTVPAVGLSMAVLGAMLAAYSARPPAKFWLVLIGAVVGELGFVLCAPAVVAAAARLARRSPLPVRLALRDAARHRSRTGPAVAAIMAAVAGATAVAIYAQSSSAGAIAGYVAQARVGQTLLQLYGSPKDYAAHRSAVQAVLGRQLGAAGVVGLPTLDAASCGHHCRGPVSLDVAHSGCPGCRLAGPARVAVGDGRLLAAVLGRSDPAASRALSQGRAVVFLADGSGSPALRLAVPPRGHRRGSTESVPATAVDVGDSGAAVTAVVPPQTATRLGLRWGTDQWLVRTASVPTLGQQDAVQSTLHRTHAGVQLFVERGYTDNSTGYKLLALAVAAAIVTLGATGVVTGLSAAESRPDLATFAAVGAAPRTRRTLAASQAGTVALLGALTGVVSGTVSAFAILRSVGSIPFTMPWAVIAGMIVGVPLVAALAVGTLVRSRLPVERRVT